MRGEREKGGGKQEWSEGSERVRAGLGEHRREPLGPPHRAGVQPGGGGQRFLALASVS